ncbi:hypothetical protein B0H17DRAFT_1267084 [Mycena rosella]|uniref:Uncharacterized protein n=1 Tax=Mycena rosella TaxID=1033263 RepID=A0AAD7CN34_MYCRO|nr:hypothetical protein B0H17DRAFT_1267084 [Mycena rosella]
MMCTRSSPTPSSVLPASFALHTATPTPPHALLSCFPALIAPYAVRQRPGMRRPVMPTPEQHHLAAQYPPRARQHPVCMLRIVLACASGVVRLCTPYALRIFIAYAAAATKWDGAGLAPAFGRIPTSYLCGLYADCIRAPYANGSAQEPDEEIDVEAPCVCADFAFRVVRVPHVHRRPEPNVHAPRRPGRTAWGLFKIRAAGGQLAASVLARVHIANIQRLLATADEHAARAVRSGGRAGWIWRADYAQSAYAGPAGTRTLAAARPAYTPVGGVFLTREDEYVESPLAVRTRTPAAGRPVHTRTWKPSAVAERAEPGSFCPCRRRGGWLVRVISLAEIFLDAHCPVGRHDDAGATSTAQEQQLTRRIHAHRRGASGGMWWNSMCTRDPTT